MKKATIFVILFLFIILIILASKITFAQETFDGSFLIIDFSSVASFYYLISPFIQVANIFNNVMIMGGLSYLKYINDWVGFGGGIDLLYNICNSNYQELYLIIYIRLALKIYHLVDYLEIGISHNIIQSRMITSYILS